MAPFEAGPGNLLFVGPRDIREVAILDADTVERPRGRPRKGRCGGLMEEDIEKRFLCGRQDLHGCTTRRASLRRSDDNLGMLLLEALPGSPGPFALQPAVIIA